jgi:hypothetical protein
MQCLQDAHLVKTHQALRLGLAGVELGNDLGFDTANLLGFRGGITRRWQLHTYIGQRILSHPAPRTHA